MPRRSKPVPQAKQSNINLETIATTLGVAVSTVSRALNNHPGIHPATRLRIQTEAARLGYNVKRRTDNRVSSGGSPDVRHLLTLAQTINNRSQQGYFTGISRAAQAHHIGVFSHHCMPQDAELIIDPLRQPAPLRMSDLVGLILIHRWPQAIVARLSENRTVVSLIHRYPGLPVDTVTLDDETNIGLLIAHLGARGHKRIGFFGYEPGFSWARTRHSAFVGALAAEGIAYEPADVIRVSSEAALAQTPPDFSTHLPALRARIKAGVTAWIGSSYVLAQGLCNILRTSGYAVPGDVSVTGYHGGARIVQPGIPHPTSIEIDDEIIGSAGVHLIAQRGQRGVPAPTVLLLPGRIVQGDST